MVKYSKFVVKVFVTLSDNSTGSFSFSYDCIPVPATRRQIPDPVIHDPAFETALEQFLVYVNSESSTQLKVLYYTIAILTYNNCNYDPIIGGCECCACTSGSYACACLGGQQSDSPCYTDSGFICGTNCYGCDAVN